MQTQGKNHKLSSIILTAIARFIFLIKQLNKIIRIFHYAEFLPCGIVKVTYLV